MSDQLAPLPAARREIFDDEHEAFRESLRRFLEGEIVPQWPDWRHAGIPRDVYRALGEYGFVGIQVPEELGGAGIDDFRFNAVVVEEAMRVGLHGLALMLSAHNDVCVPLLARHADEAVQAAWLPGLASGELIAAFMGPRSVAGSAAAEERLELRMRGDRRVLDGAVSGVVGGGVADVLVVAATTEGQSEEAVLAALDAGHAGVRRERSGELVGPRPCDRADISFDSVELAPSALLDGAGEDLVREQVVREQVSLAVLGVAGARAALAITLEYVQERRAFGQLIADFQNTRYALAEVAAEIEATEAFVDACVREQANGALTTRRAAAAKLRSGDLYGRAVDAGLQLHGGYGYMLEYPIAHAYGAARYLRLHGGTSQAMNETIAGSLGL